MGTRNSLKISEIKVNYTKESNDNKKSDLVKLCNLPYFGMVDYFLGLNISCQIRGRKFSNLDSLLGQPLPHCPLNKQNIIYFIYKREKPTKLSGIPYFWSRSSLLMSEFENFQILTPAGNFAPAFDRKIRNFYKHGTKNR